ncbi:hypothetical protein ACR6C2_38155 [Streptomyces sp. INA 01156]
MTFEDREAYLEFFRAHPALGPHWSPQLAAYVDRDLTGRSPELRSSCVLDAVRADGAGVLGDPEVLAAVHQPQVHGTLLWAERGLLDEPQALYDPARVTAAALDPTGCPPGASATPTTTRSCSRLPLAKSRPPCGPRHPLRAGGETRRTRESGRHRPGPGAFGSALAARSVNTAVTASRSRSGLRFFRASSGPPPRRRGPARG